MYVYPSSLSAGSLVIVLPLKGVLLDDDEALRPDTDIDTSVWQALSCDVDASVLSASVLSAVAAAAAVCIVVSKSLSSFTSSCNAVKSRLS